MTIDEMKALAHRLYAAGNAGDTAAADGIFAEDFYSHPMGTRGAGAVKSAWIATRTKYPEAHVMIEDMLADGDKLAIRGTVHGIPADGTDKQEPTIMEILRIEDGRVAELWGTTNLNWR